MPIMYSFLAYSWFIPIIFQVIFAIHAIRSCRYGWLWIILIFPVVGCLIYFFVEVVPELQSNPGIEQVGSTVKKLVNPEGEIRRLKDQLELCDNFSNRQALADGYAQVGRYTDAISCYLECLKTVSGEDVYLLEKLAKAYFSNKQYDDVEKILFKIKQMQGNEFKSPEAQLILARNYEAKGDKQKALAEYEQLVPKFSGQEVRCRYALLLNQSGEQAKAKKLFEELLRHVHLSPKFYQKAQAAWVKIAREQVKGRK